MQDRKKIRILVIDDDDTFRELASMLLAEAGYAIETAEDAIEGGKALLTRNFDLVISDINMPYMNGLELASLLSSDEKTASVPLILASSRMDVETISKAVALRAADYLVKPVTLERLLETVGVVKRFGLGTETPAADEFFNPEFYRTGSTSMTVPGGACQVVFTGLPKRSLALT